TLRRLHEAVATDRDVADEAVREIVYRGLEAALEALTIDVSATVDARIAGRADLGYRHPRATVDQLIHAAVVDGVERQLRVVAARIAASLAVQARVDAVPLDELRALRHEEERRASEQPLADNLVVQEAGEVDRLGARRVGLLVVAAVAERQDRGNV